VYTWRDTWRYYVTYLTVVSFITFSLDRERERDKSRASFALALALALALARKNPPPFSTSDPLVDEQSSSRSRSFSRLESRLRSLDARETSRESKSGSRPRVSYGEQRRLTFSRCAQPQVTLGLHAGCLRKMGDDSRQTVPERRRR